MRIAEVVRLDFSPLLLRGGIEVAVYLKFCYKLCLNWENSGGCLTILPFMLQVVQKCGLILWQMQLSFKLDLGLSKLDYWAIATMSQFRHPFQFWKFFSYFVLEKWFLHLLFSSCCLCFMDLLNVSCTAHVWECVTTGILVPSLHFTFTVFLEARQKLLCYVFKICC